MLCRVYANVMDRKVTTAEQIIDHAEELLNMLLKGNRKQIEIVTDKEIRLGSNYYGLAIL